MKLGIISSGRIVQEFLGQLGTMPFIEFTDMCVRPESRERAQSLLKDMGLGHVKLYTDRQKFLTEGSFDFVYIGSTNQAHYPQAMEALEAGRNVILEKPLTVTSGETRELFETAFSKGLWLFEAITTTRMPGYKFMEEHLPRLGQIRGCISSYSIRSRRYDDLLAGRYTPTFDPECAGGAMMDLGVYSLYIAAGLFGRPERVMYLPNTQNGVDTSGTGLWQYPGFAVTFTVAKDSTAPSFFIIQGDKGYIRMDGTPNLCDKVRCVMLDGQVYSMENSRHRMHIEFSDFEDMWSRGDYQACHKAAELSQLVMDLLVKTRDNSGTLERAD